MDFCVNFFCGFLGAFRTFKRRTEKSTENPQQTSRRNPCKIRACSEKRRRKIHSAGREARETWSTLIWGIGLHSDEPSSMPGTFCVFDASHAGGHFRRALSNFRGIAMLLRLLLLHVSTRRLFGCQWEIVCYQCWSEGPSKPPDLEPPSPPPTYVLQSFCCAFPKPERKKTEFGKSGGLVARATCANRFARIIRTWNPYFYSAWGRFAWITWIPDSRESRHQVWGPFPSISREAEKGTAIKTPGGGGCGGPKSAEGLSGLLSSAGHFSDFESRLKHCVCFRLWLWRFRPRWSCQQVLGGSSSNPHPGQSIRLDSCWLTTMGP